MCTNHWCSLQPTWPPHQAAYNLSTQLSNSTATTSNALNKTSLLTITSHSSSSNMSSEITGVQYGLNSPEEDPNKDFYLKAQYATGLICYPILCIFGLAGNLLSIVVLAQKKMQTSTNTYLIAMAFSDTIKLINDSFYFLVILLIHLKPPLGHQAYSYLYPYAHYFFNMSVCITAWITVTVAIERYFLVCHPATARGLCTLYRARVICVCVFISMSLLTIPLGLRYKTIDVYNNETQTYTVDVQVTRLWQNHQFVIVYTWIQNLLRTIIPLVLLCILNSFIMQALHKTRSTNKKLSSRHRITLMLISVIFVFVVCCIPDAIMSAVFGFGYTDADYLVRAIREITDMLLTVNSAVNFVLYCTFNKVFRRNFVTLVSTRVYGHGLLVPEETVGRRSSYIVIKPTASGPSQVRTELVNGNCTAEVTML